MGKVFRDMGLREEAIEIMVEKNKKAGLGVVTADLHEIVEKLNEELDFGDISHALDALPIFWQGLSHLSWENIWKALSTFSNALWNLCWYTPFKIVWTLWNAFWDLCWYNIFGPVIDYGYRPGNALFVSLFLILLGYLTFRVGKDHQIITPTNEGAYKRNGELTELYPKFNAFIYSMETFVPLLNLGISDNWIANANHGAELPRLHKLLLPLSKLTLEVRYGVDGARLTFVS